MKHNYFISISCAILTAGLLLCLTVFMLGDFNFEAIASTATYVREEMTVPAGEINRICTDLNGNRVRIQAEDRDDIQIQYYKSEELDYQLFQEGETLTIKSKAPGWNLQFKYGAFSSIVNSMKGELVLLVPYSFRGDLDLKTTNASIRVKGLHEINSIVLQSQNNSLRMEDVTCTQLTMDTMNASIRMERVLAQSATLATQNASIRLNEVSIGQMLRAETMNGSIRFQQLACPDIELKTSNASVKGTLAGAAADYYVVSDVSNGSSNLRTTPYHNQPNRLFVQTTNASARIDFSR